MIELNNLSKQIIDGIQDRKGRNVTVLDLSGIDTAVASTFIIAEGTSTMHTTSVADNVREYVQEHIDVKPFNYTGYRSAQWIVIDYGEVMVHIFTPETRQLYALEELWSDAPIADIPDLD